MQVTSPLVLTSKVTTEFAYNSVEICVLLPLVISQS